MKDVIYRENKTCDRKMKYKHIVIAYISKEKFHETYPEYEGGYQIIGAMGKGVKQPKGEMQIENAIIPYYFLKFPKLIYRIDGFIEVEKDVYIAVLKCKYGKLLFNLLALLCLLFGIVTYVQYRSSIPIDNLANKYTPPLDMPENTDTSHIAIPGYSDIKMEAGTDTAYVSLWNPDGNPCYFIFTILDRESKKELYQSKLIPPGYAVSEIKLNQKVGKGIYPIIISISTYDLTDYKKKLNGGEVQTNLQGIVKQESMSE